jgi:predicted Fe-S protein YdhL (DUF1289 family)
MRYFFFFLFTVLITASLPAMAEEGFRDGPDGERIEKFKNMSEDERATFIKKRKAKWDAMSRDEKLKEITERHERIKSRRDEKWNSMSDAEKLKFIEEKHAKRRAKHDEHWNGMNDDEKIKFVEEKMERMGKGKHKKRHKRNDRD